METMIILTNTKMRKELETIQGKTYKVDKFVDMIAKDLGTEDFSLYSLSDFMDSYNNEEIDERNTMMGYINLTG